VAVELAPSVWWLERTRGCNAYVLRADDGSYAVIDPGFGANARAIVEQARTIAGSAPVTLVLLTHGHGDHVAAAAKVAEALGARIALGEGDCEADGAGGWRVARALQRRGPPSGPVPVHLPLLKRTEIAPGIEAVPTPGHTRGSTCYIARRAGVSFVGDLVISHHDGLARALAAANVDDTEYLATLARFASDDATDFGLAGHGHPVRTGFATALRTLAAQPRERGGLRVRLRRVGRMARFMIWMMLPDRPRRR